MDSLEKLWIRACKSNDPELRFNSIVRRFYCTKNVRQLTAIELSDIVDLYCPISAGKLLREGSSTLGVTLQEDYIDTLNRVLRQHIRWTKSKDIKGFK